LIPLPPKQGRGLAAAGALLAATGIALGAFAAHGLRGTLDARAMGWWQTAVEYQMWNAVGLLALGVLGERLRLSGLLIGLGLLLFCGSLYVMALTGWRQLGMVTPVGGVLMIAGWIYAGWRVAGFRQP